MVHLRLNEREANPNRHVNFISPLPAPDVPSPYSEEDARQLLRALAAQVRPVMKSHGFAVNSFEEYEYNRVFAGRNWNNGETIELVLRRADGTFVPIPWLLSTLCHELAHIKHMSHGREFQRLWARLRTEVEALQERGYFGDGYWSGGTRISDSVRIGGQGIEDFDLPEYVCGGAQTRSRPKSLGRRRRIQRRVAGPSNHTGAQVERRRKPGTRVKARVAFKGEGKALNDDISDEEAKGKGTGFRKQAGSKRAREERALAAERRLKAPKGEPTKLQEKSPFEAESSTESDSEYDEPRETDESRRQALKDSTREDDVLNSSQRFMEDFLSSIKKARAKPEGDVNDDKLKSVFDAIEISDDEDGGKGSCVIPSTSNPVTPRPPNSPHSTQDTRPLERVRQDSPGHPTQLQSESGPSRATPFDSKKTESPKIVIGRIVKEEMAFRKKEALGLTGVGRKLGSASSSGIQKPKPERQRNSPLKKSVERGPVWSCLVCTLENVPGHLACSACGTPRGESQWPQH